ncbi:MAG: PAQR family membrane homeostasis protein TrhA [Bacillota bacterium]
MKKERLGELIANAISHGVGIVFGVTAFIILLQRADQPIMISAVLLFSLSLILLYTASTLFHAFPNSMKRVFNVFQRLDHAGIYILIAGTYTPLILLLVPNLKGYILLGVLWTIAITGVVFKSIWIHKFKTVHLLMYLFMGWSVVFVWPDMSQAISPNALRFLWIGGLSYTVGVIFYIQRFTYAHFIWHLFVLSGSLFHFMSIYTLL